MKNYIDFRAIHNTVYLSLIKQQGLTENQKIQNNYNTVTHVMT